MYKLFTDGGSRGNPGSSAVSYVLLENNHVIKFDARFNGLNTNNHAEYTALEFGLRECVKKKITSIDCYLDSELIVKQMNGEYSVKNENIINIYKRIKKLANEFKMITFTHIPRSENHLADKLVNIVLDAHENK